MHESNDYAVGVFGQVTDEFHICASSGWGFHNVFELPEETINDSRDIYFEIALGNGEHYRMVIRENGEFISNTHFFIKNDHIAQ